jgi:peroxiredoxin
MRDAYGSSRAAARQQIKRRLLPFAGKAVHSGGCMTIRLERTSHPTGRWETQLQSRTIAEAYDDARALDAPLSERLASYARSVRELNAPMAEAVDRLVSRLQGSKLGAGAPREGKEMPPFLLPDHAGHLVALSDLLKTGPVAVTFARGHWCPYCRIAVSALADVADEVAAIGAQLVAIVPDRQEFAAKLREETQAPFPILTDVDNGYALALGLVFWVDEEMQRHMLDRNIDPTKSQGNDSWFVPVPATFVVGRDGKIIARHVDPDYRTRIEIDAVVAALKAAVAHGQE